MTSRHLATSLCLVLGCGAHAAATHDGSAALSVDEPSPSASTQQRSDPPPSPHGSEVEAPPATEIPSPGPGWAFDETRWERVQALDTAEGVRNAAHSHSFLVEVSNHGSVLVCQSNAYLLMYDPQSTESLTEPIDDEELGLQVEGRRQPVQAQFVCEGRVCMTMSDIFVFDVDGEEDRLRFAGQAEGFNPIPEDDEERAWTLSEIERVVERADAMSARCP